MVMPSGWPLLNVRHVCLSPLPGAEQIMVMPLGARKHWTADEVRTLTARQRGWWPRYELVAGALLVTPAPTVVHQRVHSSLFVALGRYLLREPVGALFSSPADLSLGANTVVQPDLFVVPADVDAQTESWSDVSRLLLAVEILSPSTAFHDRGVKRELYQRASVDEYWIVDYSSRVVERWRPTDERPDVLRDELAWLPPGAASPLRLDLHALFSLIEAGPAGPADAGA